MTELEREEKGRGVRMLQSGGVSLLGGVNFPEALGPRRALWEFSEMFEVC